MSKQKQSWDLNFCCLTPSPTPNHYHDTFCSKMAGSGRQSWVQGLGNLTIGLSCFKLLGVAQTGFRKYESLSFFSTAIPVTMSFDLHIRLCPVDEKMGHSRSKRFLPKVTHLVTDVETAGDAWNNQRSKSHQVTAVSQASPPASWFWRRARCRSALEVAEDEPAAVEMSQSRAWILEAAV